MIHVLKKSSDSAYIPKNVFKSMFSFFPLQRKLRHQDIVTWRGVGFGGTLTRTNISTGASLCT